MTDMRSLLLFISAIIFISTCIESDKNPNTKSENMEAQAELIQNNVIEQYWIYEGETDPEHWEEIGQNSSCEGYRQSPVDIIERDALITNSGLKISDLHYPKETTIHSVTNSGHSIQYNFDRRDHYVTFKMKRYNLAQFHFHAPAEHTLNGVRYPLAIHMVHQSKDNHFVVFAIMVEEGENNEIFDFLESYLPLYGDETKEIGQPHNFNHYISDNFDHFYYKGSLTTPPCTETVNWFVFKNPFTISSGQVKLLAALMPRKNYREEQPLNGRRVFLSR